jgi:S-adenosyl methyltransferase
MSISLACANRPGGCPPRGGTGPGRAHRLRGTGCWLPSAAAAGISQFLDLGSGLPAHPAVHEAVRKVIPDARVCYVDIDAVAVLHGEALLARGEGSPLCRQT